MARFILIIEDTATLAESLGLAFEGIEGTEAVLFGCAREAVRFLRAEHRSIAAIVTDLNLPDDDGFTLIKEIRAVNGHGSVPAILITAEENPRDRNEDILGTPNVILKKPFSMKEVRRVLETLL